MADASGVPSTPLPTISVRGSPGGVVLAVNGLLDARASDLLAEVARAALVAVKRASRIHVDLTAARLNGDDPPRVIRQLVRAGAQVSWGRDVDCRIPRGLVGQVT